MASAIVTGKRTFPVWSSSEWVTVLAGKEAGTYRVIPVESGGGEFTVSATTDAELGERITAELRLRKPQGK